MITPNGGRGAELSTKPGEYPKFALRANLRLNAGVGPQEMATLDNERIEALLTEIRDTQKEHLAEYRRIAAESVAIQNKAVEQQTRHAKLYRLVVIVCVPVIAYIIWFVVKHS